MGIVKPAGGETAGMGGGTGGGVNRRRVRILTLGCAKNGVDAEVMAGLLADGGCEVVSKGSADVAIVNTCGFIRDAKEESIEEILSLARQKEKGRIRRLVVAGCMARRYRDDLPRLMPEVDLFIGPGDIPALPGLIEGLFEGNGVRESVGEGALPEEAYRYRAAAVRGPVAYLKILEGCAHGCAYCTIPAIRGPLRSRPREALLAEARMLARKGVRELDVIGQDITSYGADRGEAGALVPLLRDICRIREIRWVRLLYLYPSGIDEGLIDLIAGEKKICPYLDIPVQHIDGEVLGRMGRRYGPEAVRSLLARLRERIPGVFLRTSLITGFPGETAGAFGRLLDFVRESRWDYLGVFTYSREEGTRAYSMRPQVPQRRRNERARRIQEVQAEILAARNEGMVGRELLVLVEETRARGTAVGRHAGQAPEVDGNVVVSGYAGPPGRFVRVRVTGRRECDLLASAR
jgi:ribosomal protein S12 methylthiotransferase